MQLVKIGCSLAAVVLLTFGASAKAADSSYTPSTVWNFSYIQTEPGQFENYMDWLAGNWKKIQELGKKEGAVVSYHILSVNNPRNGEPNLILAIEYKDYYTTAQQLDMQKKIEAMMAADQRKMESASGERKVLRKLMGSMELQELKLK